MVPAALWAALRDCSYFARLRIIVSDSMSGETGTGPAAMAASPAVLAGCALADWAGAPWSPLAGAAPAAREAASLVFLDPPYGQDLAPRALAALARAGWLVPGAVAVVEEEAGAEVEPPAGFTVLEDRRYGDTRVLFLAYGG